MTEAKKCVNLACRYYGEHVCRCYPDERAAGIEPKAMTEHRTIGSWLEENGMYRAVCCCGWRSPTWRTVSGAADSFRQHVERAAADEGAAGIEPHSGTLNVLPSNTVGRPPITHEAAAAALRGKPPENPSLPKLLRALARGTDAQEKQTSVIFDAAADELEYWRGLEAAKVIGQGHQNNDNVPARADHKYEPGTFGVCRRCGKGPH